MVCRIAELQYKEVIDISNGTRYGFVEDVELDPERGTIERNRFIPKSSFNAVETKMGKPACQFPSIIAEYGITCKKLMKTSAVSS